MSEEHFPPPLIFIKIQIDITSEIRQEAYSYSSAALCDHSQVL